MIGLKNKSEINSDAAKLLHDKNYYAPSIHCSYYSCLQLMIYSLNSHFNFTEKYVKYNKFSIRNFK